MSVAKDFIDALKSTQKKTKPADDDAVVRRIEGNTAWVHIPGGVDETPVQMTINCEIGETVKVRRADGRAWIVGNGTAPPTDDKRAIRAEIKAIEASRTASDYITDTQNGVFVHPADDATSGWKIADAIELLRNGVSYIWAGLANGLATVRVGRLDSGHTHMDSNGMRVYGGDGSEQLANIGYGEGNPETGSTPVSAPYYTLGKRKSGSDIGNWSVAEGYKTEASAAYAHAEGRDGVASGGGSHAEGTYCRATGTGSHAEGSNTVASGLASHAAGRSTVADQNYQTAVGKYNTENNADNLFVVGNGTDGTSRSDAFEVDKNGYANVQTGYKVGGYPIIETATKSESTGSFTGYLNLEVKPTIPHGKTPIGIIDIHVNGNGSSNCQLIGFYVDSNTGYLRIQMKNTSSTSYTWTVDVTGLYI